MVKSLAIVTVVPVGGENHNSPLDAAPVHLKLPKVSSCTLVSPLPPPVAKST